MKSSNSLWKEKLAGKMPENLAREIDIFETEIALRKQGKIDERVFAETRLRRGTYGQRYDNGQRHDGTKVQQMPYPSDDLTKGPNTMWDAPGMQRIKIPGGGLNAEQLETMAELAEEYSDGIAHVTTRQDFQLHYIHIEDTPSLMRRLAAVGHHHARGLRQFGAQRDGLPVRRRLPGRSVRRDAVFARALEVPAGPSRLPELRPQVQAGVQRLRAACLRADQSARHRLHRGDAQRRTASRSAVSQTYVGGGLGAVPYQAKLFDSFVPVEEMLPLAQAIARVFARLGEKKNRNRARIKFLVQDLGIEKFKELVLEERKTLPHDPRWTDFVDDAETVRGGAAEAGRRDVPAAASEAFARWVESNTRPQKQEGYVTVTVALPLGDITANQLRALADIVRRFTKETIRTTVEQNFVIRWVSKSDLPEMYKALEAAGLGDAGRGHDRRYRHLPGHGHLQAGHFVFARTGGGTAQATGREKFRTR